MDAKDDYYTAFRILRLHAPRMLSYFQVQTICGGELLKESYDAAYKVYLNNI